MMANSRNRKSLGAGDAKFTTSEIASIKPSRNHKQCSPRTEEGTSRAERAETKGRRAMEPPLSPETDAVELRDCMEELLKFTLQSHVSQTLGLDFDLGLSTNYCSALLQEDGNDLNASTSPSSGPFQGVPPYPLYRRLAVALSEAIYSGMLCKKNEKKATSLKLNDEKGPINQNRELDEPIQQRGAELLNMD